MPELTPTQKPALPVPADLLLSRELRQKSRFSTPNPRLSTGSRLLDSLFDTQKRGVERGTVLGISAGEEGVLVSLNLLASVLLPHLEKGGAGGVKVRVVAGSAFPLPLLAKVLESRIRGAREGPELRETTSGNFGLAGKGEGDGDGDGEGLVGDVEGLVGRALEMVGVTRIFDIEGLEEVLSELSPPPAPPQNNTRDILDSEDEELEASPRGEEGLEMLLVDNMTGLLSEIMNRKEKSEAHHILNSLSQTLHHLTKTRNWLTVLHNGLTPTSTRNQGSSVFADAGMRPALGVVFEQFLGLHVCVTEMPRGRRDAEVVYGEGEGGVQRCFVVEVLRDDGGEGGGYKGREERWVPVEVDGDGTGFGGVFGDRGVMRGLGLESNGVGRDVGGVAKIWGFGGRRV